MDREQQKCRKVQTETGARERAEEESVIGVHDGAERKRDTLNELITEQNPGECQEPHTLIGAGVPALHLCLKMHEKNTAKMLNLLVINS